MGASKRYLMEPQPGDELTIRCDRCHELVPWHDAVVGGEPLTMSEARGVRNNAEWVFALCSYCDHMVSKDD